MSDMFFALRSNIEIKDLVLRLKNSESVKPTITNDSVKELSESLKQLK